MMKILLPCLLLSFLFEKPKVFLVNMEEEIRNADFVKEVNIIGYEDTVMLYRVEHSRDTLRLNCSIRIYSEVWENSPHHTLDDGQKRFEGTWPQPGEKLLMVSGNLSKKMFFAKQEGGYFRFWCPRSIPFANYVFVVNEKGPAYPLPSCGRTGAETTEGFICSDGCLMKTGDVREK